MANYCSTTRTNYFHVKDPDKFRALMEDVVGVELWDETDDAGQPVFAFGSYGRIEGTDPYDDDAYDKFITALQEHVADDDAVIIIEVGNEKLRYLVGLALVVTSKGCDNVDLNGEAIELARKMLSNKKYDTILSY